MKRAISWIAFLLFASFVFPVDILAGEKQAVGEQRPNIVFLLVDDLGWSDLGCYGSEFYETPHIDRLAQRGVRFTQAYAACPVCSPTRASILTGRHPVRVGITDWIPGQNAEGRLGTKYKHINDRDELALEELTTAELLKSVGYQTFFVGKWHLGSKGFLPTDQGFDKNIAGFHVGSPPGGYYSPFKNPYLEEKQNNEYLTERLTAESIELIASRDKSRPFFLNLCYYNVHTPIQAYRKRFEHFRQKASGIKGPTPTRIEHEGETRLRQDNAEYASMVAAVDDSVGAIIEAIEKEGLTKNTIIFLFSDNGGLSTLKKLGPTANLPLRAGKGWLYEGGIREPLIVVAPGKTAVGTTCNNVVVSTDFLPTIAQLVDVELPANHVVDGQSFVGVLAGNDGADRTLYWHYPHYHGSTWTPGAAIREGDWKLIEFYHHDKFEMYNLADDPGESHDSVASHPEVAERLRAKLLSWQRQMGASMPQLLE